MDRLTDLVNAAVALARQEGAEVTVYAHPDESARVETETPTSWDGHRVEGGRIVMTESWRKL